LQEELVDLVTEDDVPTGTATIGECVGRGLLHRAVAVLVVRGNGDFVLQQRSKRDLWQPGLWTLSSTGHVRAGETYSHAAVRELNEELGITAKLSRVGKYLIPPIRSGELTEREWVTSYVAKTDRACRIDGDEVEAVMEAGEPRLRLMFVDGSMTPDAVMLLTEYLKRQSRHFDR